MGFPLYLGLPSEIFRVASFILQIQHVAINNTIKHLFIKIDHSTKDKSKKAKNITSVQVRLLWFCFWRQNMLFLRQELLYFLYGRRQNKMQGMLYQETKIGVEETCKEKQDGSDFCVFFVVIRSISRTVHSGS